MKFEALTIEVTASCNFTCNYCYQKKLKRRLSNNDIKKSLDFFYPYLENDCYINFFGGEPLLEIENIRWALEYIGKKEKKNPKNLRFSTTTNGSLITDNILELFNKYKFEILLSFDGLAQEVERQPGSFQKTVDIIKKIQEYPDINLETNSVFTTKTIHLLFNSIKYISDLGIPNISHTLNSMETWSDKSLAIYQIQLQKVSKWLANHDKTGNFIPVNIFNNESERESGIFGCTAGGDRIAIAPDSTIWGCHRIADYYLGNEKKPDYKKYCFGTLNDFIKNHKIIYNKKLLEHSHFQMDHFWTDKKLCAQCEEVIRCVRCPFSFPCNQLIIGKIPSWVCEMKRIEGKTRLDYHRMQERQELKKKQNEMNQNIV